MSSSSLLPSVTNSKKPLFILHQTFLPQCLLVEDAHIMVFIGILVGDGIGQIIKCDDIRAMFVRRLDGRQQIADAAKQHDFLHKVKEHRSLSFTEEE